jgi:hypothetical protein
MADKKINRTNPTVTTTSGKSVDGDKTAERKSAVARFGRKFACIKAGRKTNSAHWG